MNEMARSNCTFWGVMLSGRARLSIGVAAASFAVGVLVMLLVGWGYQSDMKLKDRELETLRIAHKNEIASLRRSHTAAMSRKEHTDELIRDLIRKVDARCIR